MGLCCSEYIHAKTQHLNTCLELNLALHGISSSFPNLSKDLKEKKRKQLQDQDLLANHHHVSNKTIFVISTSPMPSFCTRLQRACAASRIGNTDFLNSEIKNGKSAPALVNYLGGLPGITGMLA